MIEIDKSWTLFLDRDGVINKRLMGDYVKTVAEFEFLDKVLPTISQLSKQFGKIFVVTNQQGIGKKLMTHQDLDQIHKHMKSQIEIHGGKIDKVYYAPQLAHENSEMRKPKIGMALQAQDEFKNIDFRKSILVGDSDSDIEFGKNAGMITVFLQTSSRESKCEPDFLIENLSDIFTVLKITT